MAESQDHRVLFGGVRFGAGHLKGDPWFLVGAGHGDSVAYVAYRYKGRMRTGISGEWDILLCVQCNIRYAPSWGAYPSLYFYYVDTASR